MYKRKLNLNAKKAQTATEYIVIVAVVIVIALVVVQIMGGFPGIGSSTTKKVSDYKLASTGEIGIEKYDFFDGYVLAKVKNNYYETLTVNNFTITGSNGIGVLCYLNNTNISGTSSLAFPLTLNPGQSIVINCTGAFNLTQNNGATPSVSSTYINPATGASYTISSSGSLVGGNISGNESGGGSSPVENCTNGIDDDSDTLVDCNDVVDCSSTEYCIVSNFRQGLVGYWPLNGDTNDNSSSGINGVLNGAIPTSEGKISGGYNVSGAPQNIIDFGNSAKFDMLSTTNWSVSLWAYIDRDSYPYYGDGLVGKLMGCCPSPRIGWGLVVVGTFLPSDTGKIFMYESRSDGARFLPASQNTITGLKQWNHIAISYNASTNNVTYYVNGLPSGSYSYVQTTSNPGYTMVLGNMYGYDDPDNNWASRGTLDELSVWNRTLTSAEMWSLYNNTNGRSLVQ